MAVPSDMAVENDEDKEMLAAVAKRLGNAAVGFSRLGFVSFWCQLVLNVVAAVVLVFSNLFSSVSNAAARAPQTVSAGSTAGQWLTLAGIAFGLLSVFWAFGYTRLAQRLRVGVKKPKQAPRRADVINTLTQGVTINLVGILLGTLGLEATVGILVAKTLTSGTSPLVGGAVYNPVLALDVFLVQASTNSILAHVIAIIVSLLLLRQLTNPAEVVADKGRPFVATASAS
eukprot:jgi/Mesvir1/898/Mv17460-RA.1